MKKKSPSTAKAIPKASPKRAMKCGQSRPNSKLSTVPVTAPTAKVTPIAFDQRRASRIASGSSRLSPSQLAVRIIAGRATPRQERTMWKASVNAISSRAASRLDIAQARAWR